MARVVVARTVGLPHMRRWPFSNVGFDVAGGAERVRRAECGGRFPLAAWAAMLGVFYFSGMRYMYSRQVALLRRMLAA
eukprot:IDg15277t1